MTHRFSLLLLALCLLFLPACTIFEPGGPSAAITVRARNSFQVADVVERVFVDRGYQPILRESDGITFEREGTKTDRLLYGDWDDRRVTRRVKVTVASAGERAYRLRCIPFVTRDPHDVSFEDQHRSPQVFSFHFSALLREVRGQCEELWKSRGDDQAD
jgi:hypothetical protein